ncbi:MAG: SCP2 sterol-binding domain-containing protein [Pseudomonadales bacterium]|jgi:ubiquinone biosynthesis protein UbiJ|nr:SCP2 sterol-binding domain-containing protein [Gammaproteobacteria bacterium]MBP6052646.1 SCP2 sterol-binding domain-containing protein [Pseudomonadales bacterium]MBP6227713.1 SCP2 sterol-binding domain-containing protein [Pseudomonadales bacterium]
MSARASTLNAAALAALERAINGALAMDRLGAARIAALRSQVFALHCTVPAFDVFVIPGDTGVRLLGHYEGKTSCSVSGAASDFVALLGATDKASTLVNGALRIAGDSAPLLELQKALAGLDLDWEQRLGVLLGDIPAHRIGRAVRGSVRWGRGTHDSLLRHVEEFIHEEARLAPPRLEVENFFGDLRTLAQGSDRLQASTRRLARRMSAIAGRLKARGG